jgi:hypothetical protein
MHGDGMKWPLCWIAPAVVLPLLSSCSDKLGKEPAFTLQTGVTLQSSSACVDFRDGQSMSLKPMADGYLVSAITPTRCEGEAIKPFMTATLEHRSTLVLNQPVPGSNASCECPRSIEVAIRGRIEPGDTLYILNDYEVLGHFTIPAPQGPRP